MYRSQLKMQSARTKLMNAETAENGGYIQTKSDFKRKESIGGKILKEGDKK